MPRMQNKIRAAFALFRVQGGNSPCIRYEKKTSVS